MPPGSPEKMVFTLRSEENWGSRISWVGEVEEEAPQIMVGKTNHKTKLRQPAAGAQFLLCSQIDRPSPPPSGGEVTVASPLPLQPLLAQPKPAAVCGEPLVVVSAAAAQRLTDANDSFVQADPIAVDQEIGAEVFCGSSPSPDPDPIKSPSPPLLERCLYEEMIHDDEEDDVLLQGGEDSPSLERCLVALTQWALMLQEVQEDREEGGLDPAVKCQCERARSLLDGLREMEKRYMDVIAYLDGRGSEDVDAAVGSLQDLVAKMQERLRLHVSISVSQPSHAVRSKSLFLVEEVCDVTGYVRDAVESLCQLVSVLLGAGRCEEHKIVDGKLMPNVNGESEGLLEEVAKVDDSAAEDIRIRVETMLTECEEDEEEGMEIDEDGLVGGGGSRKRKPGSGEKKTPPTSPTSTPSKRARKQVLPRQQQHEEEDQSASQSKMVVNLLEKNKKVPNGAGGGLLQFVLWKEALKAERRASLALAESPDEDCPVETVER